MPRPSRINSVSWLSWLPWPPGVRGPTDRPTGLSSALLCPLVGLCVVLGGCAVLPDWQHRQTREISVLVDYEVEDSEDSDDDFVVLPASNDWLTVLQLQTRPGGMRESFLGKERRVHMPPRTRRLQVLCHYKLYQRRDRNGRLVKWPTVAELFPGATRIVHTPIGGPGPGDFEEDQQDHQEQE